VKPPEFDYVAPLTLPEAVDAVSAPEAKVLAGGQSLVPLLNFRLAQPSVLVDLRRLPGLDRIERANGSVVLGAMVRQRDAQESAVLAQACPLAVEAIAQIGHPQIRSRGTVGGAIAHADPAAELPAVLLALDGRVRVVGRGGERIIAAADLFVGMLTTTIAADEILVDVELPAAPARSGAACVEIARRAGDYAICGAATQVGADGDGTVVDARVALFGVADRPVRARTVERALVGTRADAAAVGEAASTAGDDLSPPGDLHGGPEYRRHLACVVVRRALEQATERMR
jgi:carbon-monoxide dehydrogenase medium subunit